MMVCTSCGCKEIEKGDYRCPRCGRRLDREDPGRVAEPPLPIVSQGPVAAVAPEWKQELVDRLERFQHKRARQQGLFEELAQDEKPELVPRPDPVQKVVGFEDFAAHRIEPLIIEPPLKPLPAKRPGRGAPAAPQLQEPPDHAASLPSLEPITREEAFRGEILCQYPAAPLALRCVAGILDTAVGIVAVGVFLGTFYLLGGALPLARQGWGGLAAAAVALMAFYLFVYTCYGPETPGLQWMRLSVLDYGGNPPRGMQRLVRAIGLLLSAAALGLGYLWALVDEEGLTWHDRMSRTFVTRESR